MSDQLHPPVTASDVARTVDEIMKIVPQLPDTVPIGVEDGKLYQTLTKVHGENQWHTFNRRFDILFGEDCRDPNGRLLNMSRGKYGLDLVCEYLHWLLAWAASTAAALPWDAMHIKLERLLEELRSLM